MTVMGTFAVFVCDPFVDDSLVVYISECSRLDPFCYLCCVITVFICVNQNQAS
jgi:hypothetical protein